MKTYPSSIRNARLLESLYVEQKLSSREIGFQLGVNDRLVRTWLYKFGIPTRSLREANRVSGPKYRDKKELRICSVCDKEFKASRFRVKRAKKLYCSRECQIKDYASSLGKACTAFRQAHPRIAKTCPVCHTAFSVPFSHGRRKYCSYQCKGVVQMMANGAKKTPTIPEQRIIEIVGKHFPGFKYNGNGELAVVLAGMIPDFININGKKQVIEVFGDYYHGQICRNWKNSELGKTMAYNSIGYNCLVLWELEIRHRTDDELIGIIKKFSRRR